VLVAVRYAGQDGTVVEVVFIRLSSWGWAHGCSKHVEDSNKHIIEETLRQLGCLPELFQLVTVLIGRLLYSR